MKTKETHQSLYKPSIHKKDIHVGRHMREKGFTKKQGGAIFQKGRNRSEAVTKGNMLFYLLLVGVMQGINQRPQLMSQNKWVPEQELNMNRD